MNSRDQSKLRELLLKLAQERTRPESSSVPDDHDIEQLLKLRFETDARTTSEISDRVQSRARQLSKRRLRDRRPVRMEAAGALRSRLHELLVVACSARALRIFLVGRAPGIGAWRPRLRHRFRPRSDVNRARSSDARRGFGNRHAQAERWTPISGRQIVSRTWDAQSTPCCNWV